ncbi:lipoate--protein ligase [Sphingobacterium composti Ten et al. 2007 non Yoo et al. 2007]|uniref:lipoate--protein ligase n=1 Tax=Sphingobacterium composti TaxID=363260 RepID=UPI00135744D8|nr:lipoate--protein ligase [Sphingobacterium composti Ten et al. 2007 non Yoo et al. 2007]
MIVIDSPSQNAYFNIASEEYLLGRFPEEEILLFYVNSPSIIIGKFQNTLAEINLDYVSAHGIKVVRRLSGGGAVYHDLGNLNFSFHTIANETDFSDFETFTRPVIQLLNKLNVPAKLEGRNDLLVEGKKFSGNAKTIKSKKMIQHGTILINSEMSILADALKVNPLKFVDKAVKSNRARVTNLIEYLPEGTTTALFKQLFIDEIKLANEKVTIYTFDEQDLEAIEKLVNQKYRTWEWNFGSSPDYNFKKSNKIPAGFIEVHLDVHKGHITQAKIFGDFFATKPIEELENKLIGIKHDQETLNAKFKTLDLNSYFGKVSLEEISEIFN